MSKAAMIQPEQIEAAKKLLQALPVKETAKSKQQAARQLVKDFQAALKKGYTPKDISDILQQEGIAIPASLIKNAQPAKLSKGGNTATPGG